MTAIEVEIDRYLNTGGYDSDFRAWPGTFLTRCRAATADLKAALVAEIRRLSAGRELPSATSAIDLVALTRSKVAPMVRGLFARAEQDAVLPFLEKSVVFIGPDSIAEIVENEPFLSAAWRKANLYLCSIGNEPLGGHANGLVGLSEEATCYLTADYWQSDDPFADYLVHEVAHIFHNCRRSRFGLRETRGRERLLDVAFDKHETFAYACEAYSRLSEGRASARQRRSRFAALSQRPWPADDRVDSDELADILAEAVEARNGWKRILARCAPVPRAGRTLLGGPSAR